MSELAPPLRHVLEATGYLRDGRPAASTVTLANGKERNRRRAFHPDVQWRGQTNLNVCFKYAESPSNEEIGVWQQEIWNEGNTPLLWIIGPNSTDLYNGFALPRQASVAGRNRLDTFSHDTSMAPEVSRGGRLGLTELDTRAGRLSMETGRFWHLEPRVNRKAAVDRRLLNDMASLERTLLDTGLPVDAAQGLIGRSVFAKYLVDREIITDQRLRKVCGHDVLQDVLRNRRAATHLFNWLAERFNGDMFPAKGNVPAAKHLERVADFLDGDDLETGQRSLFPYRFDLIPVELISAIYEQFVHSADAKGAGAGQSDVHYTPLAAVSLILDEVMQDLTGDETILDITCGSGVFLVEALRRLITLKSGDGKPTRAMVREALYRQIHGVDVSPAAIRIAAFSLYLAALELDPDPGLAHGIKFRPLVGKTLLVGDAYEIETTPEGKAALMAKTGRKRFDVIVGNPPWTYRGRHGTGRRRAITPGRVRSPRGVSLDFVERAKDFAHERTRFGMVLSATPFFSRSGTSRAAAQHLVESLSPLTLVNLANQASWLFPRANMPAMALIGRYRKQKPGIMQLVQAPWSPAGPGSHTFEIGGSDVQTLHLASWKRNPDLFKGVFFGRLHDHLLLEELFENQQPLKARLAALDTGLNPGMTLGDRSKDAGFLRGMPMLRSNLARFSVQRELPALDERGAERPREPSIYRAPLLIVQEFMQASPRPVAAVAEEDVVFTNAYFGASFTPVHGEIPYLLAGILSSALASWYFIMAGSTFGLWKQRILKGDVEMMPAPDLEEAAASEHGRRVSRLVRRVRGRSPNEMDWDVLDEAVFDLYGLDRAERIVARDGLFRAGWQWQEGRRASVAPADDAQLEDYARVFVATFDFWFAAANERRLRADVYRTTASDPLRLIRFVIEQNPPPSVVDAVPSAGRLYDVLADTAERLEISVDDDLARFGELRLTDRHEVVIVKPSARRHWLAVNALSDARAVLEESFQSAPV